MDFGTLFSTVWFKFWVIFCFVSCMLTPSSSLAEIYPLMWTTSMRFFSSDGCMGYPSGYLNGSLPCRATRASPLCHWLLSLGHALRPHLRLSSTLRQDSLQRILGMVKIYQKVLQGAAQVLAPLTDTLTQGSWKVPILVPCDGLRLHQSQGSSLLRSRTHSSST